MVTAFKKVDGVSDVKTDYAKATATVVFDPKKTSVEKLRENGLKDTKYKVEKLEDTP